METNYYKITYGIEARIQVFCDSELAREIWNRYHGSHALPTFIWNQEKITKEIYDAIPEEERVKVL